MRPVYNGKYHNTTLIAVLFTVLLGLKHRVKLCTTLIYLVCSVRTNLPAGKPRPYLVNFYSILSNHLNMLKPVLWGALLVATSLLNTYKVLSKSDKNKPSYEQNTICPYFDP